MTRKPKGEVVRRRHADENHDVVTVTGGGGIMPRPCIPCPWRRENAGDFPTEAFRLSASTAYDMATHTFACHVAGKDNPRTCAGAALRTDHSLALRMRAREVAEVQEGDADLFDNYREMAEANGVDPDDPVLEPCR